MTTSKFVELENGPTLSAVGTDWRKDKSMLERNLHMLQNQTFCDVTFVVGENLKSKTELIKAHSFVLVSGSSVFHKILSSSTPMQNDTISVPDVKPQTFRTILE